MNKRDLIVAILATFCLTATLFLVLPSRSTEKDPWADVSGPTPSEPDGVVNMRDIQYEIIHFNQDVSNMTRNVNVTNWPSTVNPQDSDFAWFPGIMNIAPSSYWSSGSLSTIGFRQVTLKIYTNTTIAVTVIQGLEIESPVPAMGPMSHDYYDVNDEFTKTYNVMGTDFWIQINNWRSPTTAAEVSCYVYMNSIPSLECEPLYDKQSWRVNISEGMNPFSSFQCGGFSRMGINVSPIEASDGTYSVTLYAYEISWGTATESLPPSALNVTFTVYNRTMITVYSSTFITETKWSNCALRWKVIGTAPPPNWWITFNVEAYLRNE